MKFLFVILCVASPHFTSSARACATDVPAKKQSASDWKKYWLAHKGVTPGSNRKPAGSETTLPDANAADPWGGSDAKHWAPEAILANAVSHALNEGFTRAGVKDVLVSVPVKMLNSAIRPYVDGQTNASLSFGKGWSQSQPQFVASLILFKSGESLIRFRLHSSLSFSSDELVLHYSVNGKSVEVSIPGKRETSSGDFVAEWNPAFAKNGAPVWGTLYQNHVAFVRPKSWTDWFPVDFRDVVKSNSELLAELPESWQKLGRGTMLDPENASVQGSKDDSVPFDNAQMESANFGSDINGERFFPVPGSGIHNEFILDGQTVTTAVGHGNTLVMRKAPSKFKSAYICFDARNPGDEKTYGVPSGGGWHEIGDHAETVLNSLENSPVVFGYANGVPIAQAPSGNFNWDLKDIAVVRKLKPGSALITAAGPRTLLEDHDGTRGGSEGSGRNYHWFIFDQAHEVCAVEWVHPCDPSPSNHDGLVCP